MSNNDFYGYTKDVHELAERYLNRDILANQNILIAEALKLPEDIAGICFDNIINLYSVDDEIQEILEWWLVSKWLADHLSNINEPVLFADSGCYWGRTCSGQAIILDGTLQQIAKKHLAPIDPVDSETKVIAELNDECRSSVMMPVFGKRPCKVMMTQGITALSPEDQIVIAAKVRDFDGFSEENNPHGERDFGAFNHNGQKIFWKIDCYDTALQFGSEDPSDPEKTCRVLTIFLASEY